MPHKPGSRRSNANGREEREQKLRSFIEASLGRDTAERGVAIQLLARSGDSLVVRVVLAMAEQLAADGRAAQIVLASTAGEDGGPCAMDDGEVTARFEHEIRILDDNRIREGHEQLIVGDAGVWFGDCMRREPDKRDGFECFVDNDGGEAKRARQTFAALWATARPYLSQHPSSGEPLTRGDALVATAAGLDGLVETLEAWRPSTRH